MRSVHFWWSSEGAGFSVDLDGLQPEQALACVDHAGYGGLWHGLTLEYGRPRTLWISDAMSRILEQLDSLQSLVMSQASLLTLPSHEESKKWWVNLRLLRPFLTGSHWNGDLHCRLWNLPHMTVVCCCYVSEQDQKLHWLSWLKLQTAALPPPSQPGERC